ncbi:hypothetical protein [Fusobacterium gastrosuis]|uniref:hypothetical protein n=1 Tax=Fusobacterium gastrosuis TaxID=1755100 RepID=UPI002A9A47BA|nr:hypothetical protein [Fusobacterium gastrosuis]
MKKILTVMTLMFLFVSCFKKKLDSTFMVDNPTETVLELKIDDKEYKIEPMKHEKVKLDIGEHKIELVDGKKVYINVYANSKGGIINPTGAPYIFESIVYTTDDNKDTIGLTNQEILVDGVEYYGPFKVVDDFIIDRTYGDFEGGAWEFEPYEKVSETKNLGERTANISTKVNGRFEFVKLIEEEIDPTSAGDYEKNKKPYSMSAKINFDEQKYEIPNVENEDLRNKYEKLVMLDKAYFEAKTKKEQEKIDKEYKEAWKDFIHKTMELEDYSTVYTAKNIGRGVIITKVE